MLGASFGLFSSTPFTHGDCLESYIVKPAGNFTRTSSEVIFPSLKSENVIVTVTVIVWLHGSENAKIRIKVQYDI